MKKEQLINFRTTEEEASEFMDFAKLVDIPFSQIAREAIREKIAEIKKTHPRFQKKPQSVLPA